MCPCEALKSVDLREVENGWKDRLGIHCLEPAILNSSGLRAGIVRKGLK